MSCGTEEIEPGSEIPWHSHPAAEEVLTCIKRGTIFTDGSSFDFAPGVPYFVSATVDHRIVNLSGTEKLWLTWTLSPPQAVADFTQQARTHGEQTLTTVDPSDASTASGGSDVKAKPKL